MRKPPPDFVLAGAPKCGTTAIYRTLQEHSDLFLPAIKEPHYFAFDLSQLRAVEQIDRYDALYQGASSTQLRGDGSVMYLSSLEAIPAVLRRRPDAKVIATVRNPVDMFVSWHNQCFANLNEDEPNPETAWRLQLKRSGGEQLPKFCNHADAIQYKTICSLGAQVSRLFQLLPEEQRLILVYDDLEQSPRATYKRIVDFLGVRDDGRAEFLRENIYARPRSFAFARLVRAAQVVGPLKLLRLKLKPYLNRRRIYFVERFFQTNMVPVPKPLLSAQFRLELMEEFAPDISILEELLGRDLSMWRTPPPARASSTHRSGRAHG
jgi:hypothetical protein